MAFSRYNVLDYWSVGEVYKRLIKDISSNHADNLIESYSFLLRIPGIYFRMLPARQNLRINNIWKHSLLLKAGGSAFYLDQYGLYRQNDQFK